MTELNSYSINNFNLASNGAKSEIASNNTLNQSEPLHVPVRYPRLDSKIILQNMEEVLDSVKKQHKEKHRRKKELKKLAKTDVADDADVVSSSRRVTKDKSEHSEKKRKHKEKRQPKRELLQEKSIGEDGTILKESLIKTGTILQHFAPTPKKDDQKIRHDDEDLEEDLDPPKNSKITTNAFEVLMNARNKSIGSNTPGKDYPSPVVDNELGAVNAKRKLKLQEWAEQIGGDKRKLYEEARAAYVEEQLEQRAKRFKKMLLSGGTACSKDSAQIVQQENEIKMDQVKMQKKAQKIKSNTRKSHRLRRASSTDSVDFKLSTPPKVSDETSEFLSKLNSPTKKRDSLLGYFQKQDVSKELPGTKNSKEVTKQNESIKYRTQRASNKRDLSNQGTSTPSYRLLQKNTESKSCKPSGRPRRSCTDKIRYDYDLEERPSKIEKIEIGTPTHKTVTRKGNTQNSKLAQELESIDTIILDDSTNMSTSDSTTPIGTPKKLAPLFVRSLPKPSPDPEILKARQAFLQSGVPEKLRIEQEKQKQFEQNYEETMEIFPKISHVKQLRDFELEPDKGKIKLSIKLTNEGTLLSPPSTKKSKLRSIKRPSTFGSLSDCLVKDVQLQNNKCLEYSVDNVPLPSVANKREVIKSWKIEFERFPTYKCYNQMREKYRYFSAIDSAQDTEQVSESFVVTRQTRRSLEVEKKIDIDISDEEYKPPATAPNGELLFSEKYKPLLFEQVLVNLNPVTQLKEFLSNWYIGSTGSAKNSQAVDDCMDLNDSTTSNQGVSSNTIVLLGPVSSGKTYAVFALANEMNFNVLEINAGMKRTGKRLIQELQEATQSHQIRKDASGSGSSQKKLLKMSLNGLKSKLKRRSSNCAQLEAQNSDSNSSEQQSSARKCLILIEDADIVFEQTDAGFTEAIYSLAASSKRPVIIVATNPNCSHLQRLISQNSIYFSSPNVLNISKFLAVLSLIENCPVQLDDLISLYLYNNRDLRKTLLELQFFIQSGGDRQQHAQNKQSCMSTEKENTNYFASPRKRQFSVEQQESEATDTNIPTEQSNINANTSDLVYMHRSLFQFFTAAQNTKCRIPFPIDFHLLSINLNDIFQVSKKLKEDFNKNFGGKFKNDSKKHKTKTLKKQWLTEANSNSKTPLENLCSFYENLSTAALMDQQDHIHHFQNKQWLSIIDRLQPNVSESIAHCLLEKSIEINLEADFCPYNLFDTPKNRISLCEELGSMQLRSNRARYLDYEPSLRSICRSEQMRSTLERKSTRFYHYLRNYTVNLSSFSVAHFDQACQVFQEKSTPTPLLTNST